MLRISSLTPVKMYGLLICNFVDYIVSKYGEDVWDSIKNSANFDNANFAIHQVYPDNILIKLAKATRETIEVKESQLLEEVGSHFVQYIGQFGYGDILACLGRQFSDFLKTLNQLHEYLKFSYPEIQSPSFFCDNEDGYGLHLHYRSQRE